MKKRHKPITTIYTTDTGKFFSEVRLKHNLNKSGFAKALGLSLSFINLIENEKRSFSQKTYDNIVETFNLNYFEKRKLKKILYKLDEKLLSEEGIQKKRKG